MSYDYWCELTGAPLVGGIPGREFVLSVGRVGTPRLAVRWLRSEALRMAAAIDPKPDSAWLWDRDTEVCVAGAKLRSWANDWNAQGEAMEYLASGLVYVFTVFDLTSYYALWAKPSPADLCEVVRNW